MKVIKENGVIKVDAEFSREFVTKAHELNGKWRDGMWNFNESVEDALRAALMDIYGEDGSPAEYVTVKFDATDFEDESEIKIGGLQIAKRFARDSAVKFTNDSAFTAEGHFPSSGGSRNYPCINADEGTIIQVDIPKSLYEKFSDKLEIVESSDNRRANLFKEKEQLRARLAEIEKELENN